MADHSLSISFAGTEEGICNLGHFGHRVVGKIPDEKAKREYSNWASYKMLIKDAHQVTHDEQDHEQ
jgi:hypothetical protein